MSQIIALSGSLRQGSFNSALLRAAHSMFPDDIAIGSIRGIPLYDADVERDEGIPAAVSQLKDAIADSAGLLLVTPEYNNSLPGVFKNAIDWLTRPPEDIARVFHDRPVAVIGATPGGFGTILSQNAWLPVLRTLKTRPWFSGRLMVSRAAGKFTDGELADDDLEAQLKAFVGGFIAYCRS